MSKTLLIGIVDAGAVHDGECAGSLDDRLAAVRDAGTFDYYDVSPPPGEYNIYADAAARHDLPILAGGFYYRLGRDEALLEWHLRQAAELGTRSHNIQIYAEDADGRPLTDADVAEAYLTAFEIAEPSGVASCFEAHVDMWSEDFRRVERVAALVEGRGVPFRMTLDPSHVVYKIGDFSEQAVVGLDDAVAAGEIVLDPRIPGNIIDRWISSGWVAHAHARPAAPGGPPNAWMAHRSGKQGRGIQYPFLEPAPGEWHGGWGADALAAWKTAMRRLLAYWAGEDERSVFTVSTEMIPFPDYGGNARYSLLSNNVAIAEWLRAEWDEAIASGPPVDTASAS